MNSSRQNIIFIIALVVLVGGAILGYIYFSKGAPSSGALITSDADVGSGDLATVREGVLDNIKAVKDLKLDVTILSDPAFLRLQKAVRPSVPDPGKGRANPFLPYKASVSPSPSPTTPRR